MAKRRIYNSWIGIPIWIITGVSLFILFSAIYDYIVLDRSFMRYSLIVGSSLILLISIFLHFVSLKFIYKQAKRQLGG